jgi:DMSO/TMAO reductase YedYZ molybdopterin-dependent catalytic subunit
VPSRGPGPDRSGRLASALSWPAAPSPPRRAVIGAVAGAAALAASSLVAAVVPGGQSPLTSVGDEVVSLTPAGLREAAIGLLGSSDKPVILAATGILTLGIAALLGLAARHDRVPLALGGAILLAVGLAATADSSPAALPGGIAAAVAAAAAAAWSVASLCRPSAPTSSPRAQPVPAPPAPHPRPPRTWSEKEMSRRQFTLLAAAVTATAAIGQGLASLLASAGSTAVQAMRAAVRLPRVAHPLPPPAPADSFAVPGLTPLVTPNSAFYRIDTAFVPPSVDPGSWALSIDGMVRAPLSLSYDQLMDFPQVEADITLCCVSDNVGSNLVSSARWQGVPLARLLGMAGVQPGADQLVGRSVDGFTAGFPTSLATDGRAALVAVGMNGEPLPIEHGFPARLVVPGLYGYVSATKWLSEILLTTFSAFDPYWVQRGWDRLGPIVTESRIDVPQDGATVRAGTVTVAGVAWAQHRGITRVQVRVDAGPWTDAELAGVLSIDTWRQWRLSWRAPAGSHTLQVRAADATGAFQTARVAATFPGPATGYHTVQVTVA